MIDKDMVLTALSAIQDPDLHKDIVSLGFVKDINIAEDSVSLSIELTTPACPIKDQFKNTAEQLLLALPGIKKAVIKMTSRPAPVRQAVESSLKDVKNIIAVASCKGGVGKSTVAANLAMELSRRGHQVGLLDTDLFGPSVPTLFHIHDPKIEQLDKGWVSPVEYNGLKMMSFGFLFPDQPMVMRGPMVSGYIQQILHAVDWGELDYLVLDMPPGTGDIQLTITQSVRITGALIVTTPQSLAIADVIKGIQMFEKVNVPMLGIVENMSYFVCDNCDKKHYIFGTADQIPLEKRFGLTTLAHLPLERVLTEGLAIYESRPDVAAMTDAVAMALGRRTAGQDAIPTVEKAGRDLIVHWTDGSSSDIASRDLRAACQCASCVDEYSGKQILEVDSIPSDIEALEIVPIGSYAVSIKWSDGHNSGIYSWKMFKEVLGIS